MQASAGAETCKNGLGLTLAGEGDNRAPNYFIVIRHKGGSWFSEVSTLKTYRNNQSQPEYELREEPDWSESCIPILEDLEDIYEIGISFADEQWINGVGAVGNTNLFVKDVTLNGKSFDANHAVQFPGCNGKIAKTNRLYCAGELTFKIENSSGFNFAQATNIETDSDQSTTQVAELEKQRKAEEEQRRLAELEKQRKAEEEQRRLAELEKQRKAEEEQRRLAELEKQRKAEEEQRRLAELEKQRKAEEQRRLAELEKQRKAEEEQRRLAELEKQRKAEEEQRRLAELEKQRKAEEEQRRLAELEKQRKAEEEQRRLAQADKSAPYIELRVIEVNGYDAQIGGLILDDTEIVSAQINGSPLNIDENGEFNLSVYVPRTGTQITVQALDKMGKISEQELFIERQERATLQAAVFDGLNPTKRRAKKNRNAIALIIGISSYQRTEVPAIYADDDAKYFYDYAMLKLGVPEANIREFINEKADQFEILLATKKWLKRQVIEEESDIYLFFAGHGLASEDGNKMFMLPYDGAPELLDKTAILREELFADIASTKPRSVTVFMDTCYSGTTRGTETLIASRPIAIRAKKQSIPDGFTVLTAASAEETAKPLEEAKHGMFSYFVMKGMEGEADLNGNNEITAKELHAYVQKNVVKQSSGKQTPELQGAEDKVLVRFE